MTKTEIIAELRRSAAEDERPWRDMHDDAFGMSRGYWVSGEAGKFDLDKHAMRMAVLFVAHALEDECAAI